MLHKIAVFLLNRFSLVEILHINLTIAEQMSHLITLKTVRKLSENSCFSLVCCFINPTFDLKTDLALFRLAKDILSQLECLVSCVSHSVAVN